MRLKCALIGSLLISFSTAYAQIPPAQVPAAAPADTFVSLAKKMIPSVVNISTVMTLKAGRAPLPEDFFRQFFNGFSGGGQIPVLPEGGGKAMALGTGFIIDNNGTILTNNHVVEGASEITIAFTEAAHEKPAKAKVIGRDPELDIALLKVEAKDRKFEPVTFGNSDAVQIGEYVAAIGNPFGQGHSVTHGIISQTGRISPDLPLATYIQTDAPINPGNSGGPLVNLRGEVIAINNAIQANANGIGFAIPINQVKAVLPELQKNGFVRRGYLGVAIQDVPPALIEKLGNGTDPNAAFIARVDENSPGDKAGLQPYDVVTAFNGKKVNSASELLSAVAASKPGAKVPVTVKREGKEKSLTVTLGERPKSRNVAGGFGGNGGNAGNDENAPAQGKLGVIVENLNPDIKRDLQVPSSTSGVIIADVAPGSPAEQAGIQPGDIVVEANGKPVKNAESFTALVKRTKDELMLRLRRPNPDGPDSYVAAIVDFNEPGSGR